MYYHSKFNFSSPQQSASAIKYYNGLFMLAFVSIVNTYKAYSTSSFDHVLTAVRTKLVGSTPS